MCSRAPASPLPTTAASREIAPVPSTTAAAGTTTTASGQPRGRTIAPAGTPAGRTADRASASDVFRIMPSCRGGGLDVSSNQTGSLTALGCGQRLRARIFRASRAAQNTGTYPAAGSACHCPAAGSRTATSGKAGLPGRRSPTAGRRPAVGGGSAGRPCQAGRGRLGPDPGGWQTQAMTVVEDQARTALLCRGLALECATLGWNVAGIVILAIAALAARSVALGGFGLDSLIEIGASTVVIWELSGTGQRRQRRALRLIGYAFAAVALYLLAQSTVVLAAGYHPRHSALGIAWTAITAAVMFALAAGKARTGRALDNPVLTTEGRVTLVDGILAAAVLLGLALNAALNWWWADPAAGYVLVWYAGREVREIFAGDH